MPSFRFDAMDVFGREVRGYVNATTEDGVTEKVKGMGYFPIQITKVTGIASLWATVRILVAHLARGCEVRPESAQVVRDRWILPKSEEELNGILAVLMRNNLRSQQVEQARRNCSKPQANLLDTLVELGFASPGEILSAAVEFYGLEYIDLTSVEPSASVLGQFRESTVREYVFLPLSEESGVLKIAVSHPSDAEVVGSALNREVVAVLVLRGQLIEAINRSYADQAAES
jgi:hypothetical protein